LVVFSLNFPESPLQGTPGDLDETEAAPAASKVPVDGIIHN
jgi:hypothetical protein